METYVCLLVDTDRQILLVETFGVSADWEAAERAIALASANPAACGYELWKGGRKVASHFDPREH